MSDDRVKIGLEIHQQLDTATKLFCQCPTERRDPADSVNSVSRYLNPTESELGEIDEAAAAETATQTKVTYLDYDTTCLVENDEEPPHRLNQHALEIAIDLASHFDMSIADEIHVMRKIIVDGSMPSGFQRTALVGRDGTAETPVGDVSITDILLEEESGRVVNRTDGAVTYSLGRLGIPLIELGTAPVMETPSEARTVAEHLGMVLRSTLDVKRGLGTIRQDVNVSIPEGARVEIKGVQQVDTLETIINNEIARQNELVAIRSRLKERDAAVSSDPVEVTDVFDGTEADVIRTALDGDGIALALRLDGYDGILGREVFEGQTFGAELAAYARKQGVNGLFHTDELPAYGITEDEVERLQRAVEAGDEDTVILIAAEPAVAENAIEAAADRAALAKERVPEETRQAHDDGSTSFMRPLAGAARMYPETDIPSVRPTVPDSTSLELLSERAERYQNEYGLGASLAENVAFGQYVDVFEEAVESGAPPKLAATTVVETLTELRRDDVPVETLADDTIKRTLQLVATDQLVSDGIETLLREAATVDGTPDLQSLVSSHGLEPVSEDAIEEVVDDVIAENRAMIAERGENAVGPLMGQCMQELRGRADGQTVRQILMTAIDEETTEE